MKKIIIPFILLFISCTTVKENYYIKTSVAPESNIKVAVINENADSWWVSSIAYRTLITELMDVGFKVIERTNLEQIIKEQRLSTASGLAAKLVAGNEETNQEYVTSVLDKNTIKEIGNMLGVDKLIVTYVVPNRNLKISLCTIRLVDVFTGEVLTSTTVYAPLNGGSVDVLMKQAANDIMEAYKSGKKIIRNELDLETPTTNSMDRLKESLFRSKFDRNK